MDAVSNYDLVVENKVHILMYSTCNLVIPLILLSNGPIIGMLIRIIPNLLYSIEIEIAVSNFKL